MARKKRLGIQKLRVKKGDDLKTIYAKAKRAFTAADLQKFTENDDTIPARQVLVELEAIHKDVQRRRKKA
jgi:hypothetical protein